MQRATKLAAFALVFLSSVQVRADATDPVLTVLKSPTCGCCVKWMDHLHDHGFATAVEEPQDLSDRKAQLGIGLRYRSCHTGISAQGYVFEGHVPSKFIHAFLAAPPQGSIGLAVPGMPLGSPGMEVGDRFMPYQIVLLNNDGSSAVYAEVASAADQFSEQARQVQTSSE